MQSRNTFATINILFLVQAGDAACFAKTCTVTYTANFFDYTVVIFVDQSCPKDLTELMELCADQAEGISCIL